MKIARLLHPVPDAAEVLGGMSRSTLYEKIASGEIAAVKVGRRTYIAHDELERYVRALSGIRASAEPTDITEARQVVA